MKIIIAGSGCTKCKTVEKNVRQAVEELELNAAVEHNYDIRDYARLGVRLTPAVLLDGKVILSGRVPTVDEMKALLPRL